MKEEKEKKYYLCSNCGFSPDNGTTWCALGCGSDYNEMVEIRRLPEFLAKHATAVRKQVASEILGELEEDKITETEMHHQEYLKLIRSSYAKLRQRYLGGEGRKK